MSDLQCPARIIFGCSGDAEMLASAVTVERVSAVWSGSDPTVAETAGQVAQLVGVRVQADERLDDRPESESESAAVERVSRLVQEISDLGRGETALLVCQPGLIGLAVRRLCGSIPSADVTARPLAPGHTVLVEVDSSGWSCSGWPGP